MSAPFIFTLPQELAAKEPTERRGISRDEVRLMVIDRTQSNKVTHTRFDRLNEFLQSGDLLVFNSSRTLPASLKGCEANGTCLKAVDGLLTGMHEPEASHLDLLTAFLPAKQIQDAYSEALAKQYLWHEFGDLNLII
ncbi:S-adenosylmethionine:tRNA ribosyltransferase-isomerase [Pleurocapsa sp. PCC 7319]|uniref:S-adenosylmethionine:tRNA ribosyltransferase-isomerase n=1 Tax=Pleurocapsa sp. PCC 7319 TaxID=118161 RepID=UPI000347CA97|nr:S-adenosylmethionine:tRNA ribosyltransferase-isomerase [Pleurocapsa sp. PCC 7319]